MIHEVPTAEPIGRDGHLTHLGLELVLKDQLPPALAAEVDAHLDGCGACTQRLSAAAVMGDARRGLNALRACAVRFS